jgi:hypothetical protein
MNRTPLLLTLLSLPACELANSIAEEPPRPPYGSLASVALTKSPPTDTLANFYCRDLVSSIACDLFFDDPPPEKTSLKFSFETVFELGNPNSFSVPMVELLLALKVFEGRAESELATLCISFCDPQAEDCAARPPEEACKAPDTTVRSLEDFVPTVDDLVRLASEAVAGTLDDNLSFRTIPGRTFERCRPEGTSCEVCGDDAPAGDAGVAEGAGATVCCGDDAPVVLPSTCSLGQNEAGLFCEQCDGAVEARVRFDLGVDAITSILGEVAESSVDALTAGELPNFDIPYSVEGTLFFDVPVLGRFAIGFGPFASTWSLD